ncbi:MAG: DUF5069 domain-containing protein [Candidatus Eremiobacteraeota bacterium]|nr:DUF5069 domain-containing protein [Candidatus Eremiobacteraeota bacterium]
MDLTKEFPRSVHEKMHGIVQLARTTDKAKATANGNVGEYHYNCPMDQAVFSFLGIDHEKYLDAVKNAKSDQDILAYSAPFVHKKTDAEIEAWNKQYLSNEPTGDSLEYFTKVRGEIAPDRTDVTTWPDLLDLDEKRAVPIRKQTATA